MALHVVGRNHLGLFELSGSASDVDSLPTSFPVTIDGIVIDGMKTNSTFSSDDASEIRRYNEDERVWKELA